MPAEERGRVLEYAVVVLMIAGDEQDVLELPKCFINDTHNPSALINAVAINALWIEASRVTEIARNDHNIAVWQRRLERLGFQMQVAQVVAPHGSILPESSDLEPLRVVCRLSRVNA